LRIDLLLLENVICYWFIAFIAGGI